MSTLKISVLVDFLVIFAFLFMLFIKAIPRKFPSLYLGYPNISVHGKQTIPIPSLRCVIHIHEKVRQWKNVTYEVEWSLDGGRIESSEKPPPFCKPPNGQDENNSSCPGDEEIHSVLRHYAVGQRVRSYCQLINFPISRM